MFKTSLSHPIRFDAVPASAGQIGMIFCPGKKQQGAISGNWSRDLVIDLEAIHNWGATVVVSLLERFEMAELGVPELGAYVSQHNMVWMHLPIVDMSVPDSGFESTWRIAGLVLRERLRRGEKILLHCVGGLGRTGTIAARLLCELGSPPKDAIHTVRLARRGAIQSGAQEAYIYQHHQVALQDEHWSRFFGCMMGGMLGDAIGYPLEFVTGTAQDPCALIPPIRLDATPGQAQLKCSDDSQLTLATAYGLAESRTHNEIPARIRAAYLDWYAGQAGREVLNPWMHRHSAMLAARAPGTTCLQSLHALTSEKTLPPNDRKGAGALMRIAPFAFLPYSVANQQRLADQAGALTHHHPTSRMACTTWIVLLDALQTGSSMDEAAIAALAYTSNYSLAHEVKAAVKLTIELWQQGQRRPVNELGEGWIAEEALAIALYANLIGKSLNEVLHLAVCHDGDSDTTGSLAMQLYGVQHGLTALPWSCISRLDLLPALLDLPNYAAWSRASSVDEAASGITFTYGASD
jgi:ADP-ribosyl-[dinitrogen reductase] hydrolase